MSASKAVVLNGGDFAPQGTGDNGNIFWLL